MNKPICKCGGRLGVYDSLDVGVDNDGAYEEVMGICDKCGRAYTWVDIYVYRGFEELKELDE